MAGRANNPFSLQFTGRRIITGRVAYQAGAWLALGIPGLSKYGIGKRLAMSTALPRVINIFVAGNAAISCYTISRLRRLGGLGLGRRQRNAGRQQRKHDRDDQTFEF